MLYRQPCGACRNCDVRVTAVCAALEDYELGELERIMSSASLEANQTLVQQGDPLRKVYSLTSGMLRLSIDLPDGRRQITDFLMPGDYLGLAEEDVHSTTVEAVAPAQLCAFDVREMQDLIARFPRLGDRLHRLTQAALRQARDNQLILGRLTPLERLASFLLILSRRAVTHKQAANPIDLPMPRGDIADYLGVTIETVSRSFTKLRQRGLIRLPDPHRVEIVDAEALAELAGLSSH